MKGFVLLPVLVLLGCNTQPVTTQDARPVADAKVQATDLTEPREGLVQVVVKRDTGFIGGMCDMQVLLDGRPVALLATGQRVTIYLKPGAYVLAVRGPGGLCTTKLVEAEALVDPAKPPVYRISFSAQRELALTRSAT